MAKREKKTSGSSQKVWHFVRYHDRWVINIGEDTPFPIMPFFAINGGQGEVCQAMNLLRRGTEGIRLMGALHELLFWAGATKEKYQGYLLDPHRRAADEKLIARWLNCPARSVGRILRKLEFLGLIEMVDMPNFEGVYGKSANQKRWK